MLTKAKAEAKQIMDNAKTQSEKIVEESKSKATEEKERIVSSAQAEIENVMAIYVEAPLHAGLYAKAGFVQMDVNTLEANTVAGGSTYGNATVDGVVYGLGYKNTFGSDGGFYKIEGTFTEMDSMTFKSSETDKGTQISADLDVTKATIAIGYNF